MVLYQKCRSTTLLLLLFLNIIYYDYYYHVVEITYPDTESVNADGDVSQ